MNGDIYEGTFKDEMLIDGKISLVNDTIMEGTFKDNMLDGQGIKTFTCGQI